MNNLQMGIVLQHLRRAVGRHDDELGDEQLLERFARQREESAFAALLRRHGPMVLSVCRGILRQAPDVEDAFQATFLVLAQKAASIRRGESVGGWLYEVAYRVALKAQAGAVRRRQFERRTPAMTQADPLDDMTVRELRRALHEELRQLPEKYRTPLVLCYLQGKTQEEAARQLGWPKRRVKDRLQRGREQLRRRLSKRGLAPVAALTTALFAADAVSAALAGATVGVALKTDAATSAVATLAQGGCAALSVSKAKITALILLIVSLLSGAGVWWSAKPQAAAGPAAEAPAVKANDKPAAPPKGEAAKSMEIQGRVLGPDGKPKAGAKLSWFGEDDGIRQLGLSAADGSFTVAVPSETKKKSRLADYHPAYLLAHGAGDGLDFLSTARLKPGKAVELRLVKDRVIRGRLINTEGKPIADARVSVQTIQSYKSLDTFLTAWMKWHSWVQVPDGQKRLWTRAATLLATTTDADGRFALHGAGDERVVTIYFSGAGIANTQLDFVNRAGFDPKPYNRAVLDKSAPRFGSGRLAILYGPDAAIVAEAGKVIRGRVNAVDTGKGQPGAAVWLTRLGDDLPQVAFQVKTDAQGRYEIRGLRKAKKYALQVLRNPATGYMGSLIHVEDTEGYQPITADITVKKGMIVTGKVIERATGQSLPGRVRIAVLSGNRFAKDYMKYRYPRFVFDVETEADGTFRDVTIPGPVLLMGEPDIYRLPGGEVELMGFKIPFADPKCPQYFQLQPDRSLFYFGLDGVRGNVRGNSCKVLDLKPDTAIVHQDILLDRERVREVKVQDAEGRPLRGVWATGLRSLPTWHRAVWVKGDSCPVYGLEAGKPRLLIFYERDRKLAGARMLRGDERLPDVVQLRQTGAIAGRLFDADGKPLAGVVLDVHYRDEEAARVHEVVHEAKLIITDANGAFTLDELIPELKFELSFHRGKQRFERVAKPAERTIAVKAGETREVGAIELKPSAEKPES